MLTLEHKLSTQTVNTAIHKRNLRQEQQTQTHSMLTNITVKKSQFKPSIRISTMEYVGLARILTTKTGKIYWWVVS